MNLREIKELGNQVIFFFFLNLINKPTLVHVIKEKLKFLNLIVKQFLRSKTWESGIQTIC